MRVAAPVATTTSTWLVCGNISNARIETGAYAFSRIAEVPSQRLRVARGVDDVRDARPVTSRSAAARAPVRGGSSTTRRAALPHTYVSASASTTRAFATAPRCARFTRAALGTPSRLDSTQASSPTSRARRMMLDVAGAGRTARRPSRPATAADDLGDVADQRGVHGLRRLREPPGREPQRRAVGAGHPGRRVPDAGRLRRGFDRDLGPREGAARDHRLDPTEGLRRKVPLPAHVEHRQPARAEGDLRVAPAPRALEEPRQRAPRELEHRVEHRARVDFDRLVRPRLVHPHHDRAAAQAEDVHPRPRAVREGLGGRGRLDRHAAPRGRQRRPDVLDVRALLRLDGEVVPVAPSRTAWTRGRRARPGRRQATPASSPGRAPAAARGRPRVERDPPAPRSARRPRASLHRSRRAPPRRPRAPASRSTPQSREGASGTARELPTRRPPSTPPPAAARRLSFRPSAEPVGAARATGRAERAVRARSRT